MPRELLVLALSAGLSSADLAATVDKLRESSKSVGAHKRRQLFWDAYSQMSKASASVADGAWVFLKYTADASQENPEGEVEVLELTKRQRGLVSGGGVDVMGPKFKPPEDPQSPHHLWAWSEDAAQIAWDDLMHGEPCVYVTPDAVFVGTRHKRVRCKTLSSPIKTVKEAERLVGELKPDAPLRSVAFAGNDPPSVNAYNVVFAGAFKLDGALPPTIGGPINTTSVVEIYEHFLGRKQANSLAEANALITKMLADVNKGEKAPLICAASTKEAAVAYKSALMKKVYVHESMGKFIKKCKEDGAVECVVITGDDERAMGAFADHGKIVFEMFYRVDLSTMGA